MGDAKKGADEQPLSLQKEEERVQMLSICVRTETALVTFGERNFELADQALCDDAESSSHSVHFLTTPCLPPSPLRERALVGVRPQSCWGRSCARCPADHR